MRHDAFQDRFDAEPVQGETPFRYGFYRDQPGYFDLVARRDGSTLVVEAKGRSATNRRGAVAQMLGSLVMERRSDRADIRYAILLPGRSADDSSQEDLVDVRRWDAALRNHGQLDWIEVYRVSRRHGVISRDRWDAYAQAVPPKAHQG